MKSKNRLPENWAIKWSDTAVFRSALILINGKSRYPGYSGGATDYFYGIKDGIGFHIHQKEPIDVRVLTPAEFIFLTEEWVPETGEMVNVLSQNGKIHQREFLFYKDGYACADKLIRGSYVIYEAAFPISKTKEVTFSEVAQAFNTTVDLLKIKGYVNEQDAIEDVKNLSKTYVRTGIIKDMPSTPLIASYAGKNIITVSKDGRMEIDIPSIHSIINKP